MCPCLFIIIIGIIIGISDKDLVGILSIFIAITIVLVIFSSVLYILSKTHPNRISKYIDIGMYSGRIKIKDNQYREEIIEKKIKEHYFGSLNDDMIYCPKCGAEQRTGTDFCRACGKDLKMI